MSFADDPHLPQFPSDLACEAAGIDAATLKNWSSRKPSAVLIGDDERIAIGDKTAFRFTLRRVLQLAITAELVRLGFSPRDASMHAAQFTDLESSPLPGLSTHKMGQLFPRGYTLLVVRHIGFADVVNVGAEASWRDVFAGGLAGASNASSAAIVNLNVIDRRVRSVLGLDLTARPGTH